MRSRKSRSFGNARQRAPNLLRGAPQGILGGGVGSRNRRRP
ncbi:MAG: hypothetical protein R2825_23910 [Saprospiraceae bacterium]